MSLFLSEFIMPSIGISLPGPEAQKICFVTAFALWR